jgi:hypothetical protein
VAGGVVIGGVGCTVLFGHGCVPLLSPGRGARLRVSMFMSQGGCQSPG